MSIVVNVDFFPFVPYVESSFYSGESFQGLADFFRTYSVSKGKGGSSDRVFYIDKARYSEPASCNAFSLEIHAEREVPFAFVMYVEGIEIGRDSFRAFSDAESAVLQYFRSGSFQIYPYSFFYYDSAAYVLREF